MEKFTDIQQFRSAVKRVRLGHDYKGDGEDGKPIYNHTSPYPCVPFCGTVKLHGTNAAIVQYADGRYEFQSRSRKLSLEKDNSGFMAALIGEPYDMLFDDIEFNDYCAVYGEWCGKGIQKGIAISECEKMFVIFAVKIDGVYVDHSEYPSLSDHGVDGVYNILDFPAFNTVVDFNEPEVAQAEFGRITEFVEAECPVGKHFGVSGVGEGVVWQTWHGGEHYIFKVKGQKHSVSKVKTLAAVDVEKMASIREFIDYAVTEQRMKQAVSKLEEDGKPIERSSTGDFLRWIVTDILKEESDTLESNGISPKEIGKFISERARSFWFLQTGAV